MEYKVTVHAGHYDQHIAGTGILTDEHPTASYGLPVFISDLDGRVYGPGDHPMDVCTLSLHDRPDLQIGWNLPVEAWATRSGWCLAFGLPQ